MDCKTALQTILDVVDYTVGNCRVNDMVGAVLPREIIVLCREAIMKECTCALMRGGVPAYKIEDCPVHGKAHVCTCGNPKSPDAIQYAVRNVPQRRKKR